MTTSQDSAMVDNLSVLAHAVELSTKIVLCVAGADAADTVQGAQISEASVADAVAARLQVSLAPHITAGA